MKIGMKVKNGKYGTYNEFGMGLPPTHPTNLAGTTQKANFSNFGPIFKNFGMEVKNEEKNLIAVFEKS